MGRWATTFAGRGDEMLIVVGPGAVRAPDSALGYHCGGGGVWTVRALWARMASVKDSSVVTAAPGQITHLVTRPATVADGPTTEDSHAPVIRADGAIRLAPAAAWRLALK